MAKLPAPKFYRPKRVNPADVVNSIFGPGLFKLEGGRVYYDEVWMADGGEAVYLVRVEATPDGLKVTRRWIPWDAPLLQMYDLDEDGFDG